MAAAHLTEDDTAHCPFCGENLTWLFESDVDRYAVNCRHCGSIGPMGDDEETAVRLWNGRVGTID
jgi:Lar family restriction alleviation protein